MRSLLTNQDHYKALSQTYHEVTGTYIPSVSALNKFWHLNMLFKESVDMEN